MKTAAYRSTSKIRQAPEFSFNDANAKLRIAGTNRRSSAAELTPAGPKLIDKAIAVRFQEAADALSGLTEHERVRLAAVRKQLGRSLEG